MFIHSQGQHRHGDSWHCYTAFFRKDYILCKYKKPLWFTIKQKFIFVKCQCYKINSKFLSFFPSNFRNYKIFVSWNSFVHVGLPESLEELLLLKYKPLWKFISNPICDKWLLAQYFNNILFCCCFWNPVFCVPSFNPQDILQLDSKDWNEKKMLSNTNTLIIWPSEFSYIIFSWFCMVEHVNQTPWLLPTSVIAAALPGLQTTASCFQAQVRGVQVSSNPSSDLLRGQKTTPLCQWCNWIMQLGNTASFPHNPIQ